jgi:hypothetical protein
LSRGLQPVTHLLWVAHSHVVVCPFMLSPPVRTLLRVVGRSFSLFVLFVSINKTLLKLIRILAILGRGRRGRWCVAGGC